MRVLYDTNTVSALDRYEHYRAGAADELAPVEVYGRDPGRLVAAMSTERVGDFGLEVLTWMADDEIVTRRTERLIRVGDPGRYRLIVPVSGQIHLEQAGHRERFRRGDVGLFDLSRPWQAAHPPRVGHIRVVMATFPRTLLPVDEAAVRSIVGTVTPKRLPGRDVVAELLRGLPDAAQPTDYADALFECTVGLVRRRLGLGHGITPQIRRLVYVTRIRDAIRRHFHDPDLDLDRLAGAVALSPRYLHRLFQDTGVTPMQLVKRMRLDECHRRLTDPAWSSARVREIFESCGYRRADQFARDFRQRFDVAPSQVRGG